MRRFAIPALLACLALAGLAHAQFSMGNLFLTEKFAWKVDRAQTLPGIKRIGLVTVNLPDGLDDRTEAAKQLEQFVSEQLESAGIAVIGSEVYAQTRQKLMEQLGGIYDARTGALDKSKSGALYTQTLRSYTEEQQLDAVMYPEVRMRTADFYSDVAEWDGVKDKSTGMTLTGWKAFWSAPSASKGSISALSLLLFLHDTSDKPLYVGMGGIELLSYTGHGDFGGFRHVPHDSLLRDTSRMKRAAEAATLYIRTSDAEIEGRKQAEKAARRAGQKVEKQPEPVLQPQPEAPAEGAIQPFKQPRDEILARVKTVLIAPIFIREVEHAGEVSARYEKLLAEKFTGLGWQVVPSRRYMELWVAERMKSTNAAFDPYTGKSKDEELSKTRERVLAQLVGEQPVDAIVYANVIQVSAPHEGQDARWDGVQMNAVDFGPWKPGFWTGRDVTLGYGRIPALSLSVAMYDRNSQLLYVNRGGIHLLRQLIERKFEPVAKTDWLKKPEFDAEAVRLALRPLVLTPEQLELELNPPKPGKDSKKKKKEVASLTG
jgi:hypothetical protein